MQYNIGSHSSDSLAGTISVISGAHNYANVLGRHVPYILPWRFRTLKVVHNTEAQPMWLCNITKVL